MIGKQIPTGLSSKRVAPKRKHIAPSITFHGAHLPMINPVRIVENTGSAAWGWRYKRREVTARARRQDAPQHR